MPDYTPKTPNTPKPEECESCEFPTADLRPYPTPLFTNNKDTHSWLCQLCAATRAGNAHDYPRQYEESADVLRTICYVGNAILKAIQAAEHRSGMPETPSAKQDGEG